MLRNRRGFSLIEAIVITIILAVVASIALPRALKPSPAAQVDNAARALTRDLEQLRMRAIAAKRQVRVRFYRSDEFYTAYMDLTPDRLGVFDETAEEVRACQLVTRGSNGVVPGVELPSGVVFGVGQATTGPQGYGVSDPVFLDSDWVQFDTRGLVIPEGPGGIVFLTHEEDPSAVAAVTISGASAFRTWRFRGGGWIQ